MSIDADVLDLDAANLDGAEDVSADAENIDAPPPQPAPAPRRRAAARKRRSTARKRSRPAAPKAAAPKASPSRTAQEQRAALIFDRLATWTIAARMARPDVVDITDDEIDEAGPPLARILARHLPQVQLLPEGNPDVADAALIAKATYGHLIRRGKLPSPIELLGRLFKRRPMTAQPERPAASGPLPFLRRSRPPAPAGVELNVPADPPPGHVPSVDEVMGKLYADTLEPAASGND